MLSSHMTVIRLVIISFPIKHIKRLSSTGSHRRSDRLEKLFKIILTNGIATRLITGITP